MPLGTDVSENISELHRGPRYRKNVKKFGKAKANKIAIAAAFSGSRRAKRKHKGNPGKESWEDGLRKHMEKS